MNTFCIRWLFYDDYRQKNKILSAALELSRTGFSQGADVHCKAKRRVWVRGIRLRFFENKDLS